MKIIHKSILKELIFAFIISLIFLNFILMMEKLLRLTRFLSGVGASLADMATIILYIQPQLLLLTIPMALLLSTLLTYGRYCLDNELVILRTSGMNFKGISKPVFILGASCFLLNLAVSFYLGPKSSIRLRDEIIHIIKNRTPLSIEEGTYNTSFKDVVIIIREKPSDDTVKGIFIYDGRNKSEPRVMMAKEGKISMSEGFDANLNLTDGYIHIAKGNSTTEIFFDRYNLILTLESNLPSRKNAEFTPSELLERIQEKVPDALLLQLEFDRRLSLPFLCIVLFFLGPPLSLIAGKSGRLGGLALGLGVFTVYYMLLIYGENLARAGKIPHYIGAWTPVLILGIFALLIFKKESNK
ncbi:MAG: LptF/LptG family permease [Nitrospirota bacterium]|jgi:lipopolysaccharide export system permease protein